MERPRKPRWSWPPTWHGIFYAVGLLIVLTILVLVVLGRRASEPTVQSLLAIAAGLLGLPTLFRRNGGKS